jgi:hypothetical protein
MTAHVAFPATESQPAAHRLLAGAVVGAVGVVLFSAAIGSLVAGSRLGLPITTEPQAHALIAGAPYLVAAGFVHLVLAAALVLGRGLVRRVAIGGAVLGAAAAATRAAMLLTGFDPTGGPDAGRPTTQGVAILIVVGSAYALAAILASRRDRDGLPA